MSLKKWKKPSGMIIEVLDNEANDEAARKVGWVLVEEESDLSDSDVDEQESDEQPEQPVSSGEGTVLYQRLEGEMVEGEEAPEEVLIQSDLFPPELVEQKLKEGWFKTKEEAGDAPPDKPEGN